MAVIPQIASMLGHWSQCFSVDHLLILDGSIIANLASLPLSRADKLLPSWRLLDCEATHDCISLLPCNAHISYPQTSFKQVYTADSDRGCLLATSALVDNGSCYQRGEFLPFNLLQHNTTFRNLSCFLPTLSRKFLLLAHHFESDYHRQWPPLAVHRHVGRQPHWPQARNTMTAIILWTKTRMQKRCLRMRKKSRKSR